MSTFPAELNGTWEIDPVHSHLGFAAKHAVVATTRGTFTGYSGGAVIDTANPANSELWVDIDAATINTGNEMRDGHLKSADFFDVDNHGKVSYRSSSVRVDGDQIVTAGNLTMAGVTHPIELTWDFGGVATDPYGNVKAGFETAATINRKDWGLTWNAPLEAGGLLVSEKIKLNLEIEVTKQA